MAEIIYGVATSLDGFIAPSDGSADWLNAAMASGEDYGFAEFAGSMGAVLGGRRTYEKWRGWVGGGGTPAYVFSKREWPKAKKGVTITSASPREVAEEMDRKGIARAWLMGGGRLAASFRAEGLVTGYWLGVIPVLLGDGIPLFPPPGPPANL